MRTKVLLSVLVLFSLLASCNMPAGQAPIAQPPANEPAADANAMATAVELTAVARVTELAGSAAPAAAAFTATPTPTPPPAVAGPCGPTVTATVNANVRSGPGTAYDIVGSLMLGQTATIVGRNDAYTWWYIDFPGVAGNHAWIAGSVVTSACVPSVVQVVAAPPLPTEEVVEAPPTEEDEDGPALQLNPNLQLQPLKLLPDLVVTSMSVNPTPTKKGQQITVDITVKNQGLAASGNFSVQWWSSWAVVGKSLSVPSLAAGASKTLQFTYTYEGCSTYDIKAVVDGGGLVNESNEGNNSLQDSLLVKCN
ncbi:MAG: SH3 domain-containing protein [Anaerolineales bacterium]|nr:SH3 domain-containing protein [Anaerolineales bacterium]